MASSQIPNAGYGNNILDAQSACRYATCDVPFGAQLPVVSLWEIMDRYPAEVFAQGLGELKDIVQSPVWVEDESARAIVVPRLRELLAACEGAGLQMSAKKLRMLLELLSSREAPSAALAKRLAEDVYDRVVDELGLLSFYRLSPETARLYDDPSPFGDEVLSRFPTTQVDIEEAAKCLALGRSTAAVFHLMRVMEVCLKALGIRLGVQSASNRGWEAVLHKAHGAMSLPYNAKPPEWADDEPFLSEAIAMLTAVKVAWRNPTMHVERSYTPEQAEDIWRAVRALARHLATHLGETTLDASAGEESV